MASVKQVAVYFHVPFCFEKCRYCDFFSTTGRKPAVIQSILDDTIDQLVSYLSQTGSPDVATLYVGGGTPSSIGPDASRYVFTRLAKIVGSPEEWTVEVNPESVTEDILAVYADSGVNRLSVGIQTFSDRHFALIGRTGSSQANKRALDLIAERWQGDLSLDIITCLPDQTEEEAMHDLLETLHYRPDHLSLYTLTIEPGTPLYEDITSTRVPAPNDEYAQELWFSQIEYMVRNGFDHYEISNFSLAGKRCLHNMTYWRMMPYIGCGPAAVSTLPGQNRPLRLENPRDLTLFKQGHNFQWGTRYEELSPEDFFTEHLMMGLRLSDGISIKHLEAVFGVGVIGALAKTLHKWGDSGIVAVEEDRLFLSHAGRFMLDAFMLDVVAEIDGYDFQATVWPSPVGMAP